MRYALTALITAGAGMLLVGVAQGGQDEGRFVPEPDIKGYGVRGVPGATLPEMIAQCSQLRSDAGSELEFERCEQLRRSLKNQPGNARSPRTAKR